MPCHPDRVRRLYQSTVPLEPPTDAVCTICGSGLSAHVLRERGHAFTPQGWRRPSDTAAEQLERRAVDDGITANVIEGDEPDDSWGV